MATLKYDGVQADGNDTRVVSRPFLPRVSHQRLGSRGGYKTSAAATAATAATAAKPASAATLNPALAANPGIATAATAATADGNPGAASAARRRRRAHRLLRRRHIPQPVTRQHLGTDV